MIVKSAINKKKEEEKIAAFFKDNAIKRMAEERKKQREAVERETIEKQKLHEQSKFIDNAYEIGQRVFHEQLGIGHVTDVLNVGNSIMYTIDFGKLGKKAMDASYAKLKKF